MKTLRYIFGSKKPVLLLGAVLALVMAPSAMAQSSTGYEGDFINNIIDVINVVNVIVAMLTAPAAIMAGWLLTPDWTFGDFFGIRVYLYELWVLVSNIVYIIFAMLLLWMAAMGIFGNPESDYVIKKKLPVFLLGILMVPFTWFIVSFTLTIVNKGIAVVMSIPRGTIIQISQDENSSFHDRTIPTYIELSFDETEAAHGGINNLLCNASGVDGNGNPCISPAEFLANNRSGMFYMIMVYTYDIFKVQKNDLAGSGDLCTNANDDSCIRTLTGILARFTFNVLFALVFSVLLIALCIALLYRAFMLWLYIMFSPMFGLAVFFGKTKSGDNFFDNKLGFMQFFKLAIIPFLVAAILSFGLLFIGIIRDSYGSGGAAFGLPDSSGARCTSGTWSVQFCISNEGGETTSRVIIGGNAQDTRSGVGAAGQGPGRQSGAPGASDYSITFEFGGVFSEIFNEQTGGALQREGVGAISSVQDLFSYTIMNLIALVIIWMGFMSAFKMDSVLESAVKPFADFGNEVGRALKSLPGVIPIPGSNGMSIGGLLQAPGVINTQLRSQKAGDAQAFSNNIFGEGPISTEEARGLELGLEKNTEAAKTLATYMRDRKGNGYDDEEKKQIYEALKKGHVSEKHIGEIKEKVQGMQHENFEKTLHEELFKKGYLQGTSWTNFKKEIDRGAQQVSTAAAGTASAFNNLTQSLNNLDLDAQGKNLSLMIDDAEGGGTSNITGTYSQVVSQLRSKNATDQDLRDLAAAYRRKVFAESGKADSNTGAVTSQHKNSLSDLTDAGDKKKFDPVKVARFLDFEPDDPATDVAVKMFMDANRGDLKDD